MGKNIVFCADGTWNGVQADDNGDGVPDATNVLKLFSALAGQLAAASMRLQDEQEKVALDDAQQVAQVAKYLHGVGDSRNAITRVLGGVFGEGFIERIVRGYTFVSRNYVPGDRIFLVGFSRGAYTARALGGMVLKMGLLRPEAMLGADGSADPAHAYRLGAGVWAQYRRDAGKQSTLLGYLEEFKVERFQPERQLTGVPIEAIGVWDTVGSLGIPLFNPVSQRLLDVFAFADTALSPQVQHGFHAVSVDEERANFEPTLWDARSGVQQVLFAGAHADVGGGYPEEALSNWALDWMLRNLAQCGVLLDDSRQVRLYDTHIASNTPWTRQPFNAFPHAPRQHPATALFHRSVQRRLLEYAAYVPASLVSVLAGRQLPAARVVD